MSVHAESGDARSDAADAAGMSLGDRIFAFALQPYSFYWLVIAVLLGAGVYQTLRGGEIAWEAFSAAGALAGLLKVMSQAQGFRAWPWSDPPASDAPVGEEPADPDEDW